jgi:tetratricopeptide (TPR) repeat protein
LFALHPTHVESVAWVTERKDTLSTFFWLVTMATYTHYALKPSLGRYALVVVAFVLGLMAKPMLVTLPAVLLLLDYWPLRRWQLGDRQHSDFAPASLLRLVGEKLPLFVLVAASIPLTVRAQGVVVRTFEQFPLTLRIENSLVSYVQYLWMTFWPRNLAIFYPHPQEALPHWHAIASSVLLLFITAASLYLAKRSPYLLVGWLWYLGTLVPVIGIMQVGQHAYADRYTYVPTIGFYIMLVWGLAEVSARWSQRLVPLGAVTGVVLLACGIMTWKQTRHWRTSETLWSHTLRVTRSNSTAHDYLGMAFVQKNLLAEAHEEFRTSLRINPESAATHGNMAIILEKFGRYEEAARHFEASLRIHDKSAPAHAGLARIRDQQGRSVDAERHFAAALAIDPAFPDAHLGLGNIRRRQGKLQESLAHFESVLERMPNSAIAHNNKGIVLEAMGKPADAVKAYRLAKTNAPDDLLVRLNLAHSLYETGKQESAAQEFRATFDIDKNWPQAALLEAWTKATHPEASQRNGNEALRTAKIVCQATDFRMAQGLDVLAAAYAELGKFEEAIVWEKKAIELLPPSIAPEIAKELQQRLKSYLSGKPHRQN